jgi:hypothetical protein
MGLLRVSVHRVRGQASCFELFADCSNTGKTMHPAWCSGFVLGSHYLNGEGEKHKGTIHLVPEMELSQWATNGKELCQNSSWLLFLLLVNAHTGEGHGQRRTAKALLLMQGVRFGSGTNMTVRPHSHSGLRRGS